MADVYTNKSVEGFLETLYSFLGLSPCASEISRTVFKSGQDFFKNTREWRLTFNYSDIRVKQAIQELTDKGLIIPHTPRGFYRLNPSIFLRGDIMKVKLIFEQEKVTIDYERS